MLNIENIRLTGEMCWVHLLEWGGGGASKAAGRGWPPVRGRGKGIGVGGAKVTQEFVTVMVFERL